MSSEIPIQNASNLNPNSNISIRPFPSYLITLTDEAKKEYFIALKHDKHPNYVDANGFFVKGKTSENEIIKNFQTMVNDFIAKSPEKIVEISVPWHKIHLIQNLIYKHKGK